MSPRTVLLLFGLVAALGVSAETFTLSAKPGQVNPKPLGTPSPRAALSASLQITHFKPSKKWPPAAYVGFFQGNSRDNSVQFLVIRNRKKDRYVVAGYRIMEHGKEVKLVSLANLSIKGKAQLTMSIDHGLVTLKFPPQAPITFRTNLTEVSPYVSVSSGTAKFSIGP